MQQTKRDRWDDEHVYGGDAVGITGRAFDPAAGDSNPFASRWFPSILALEIGTVRGPAKDSRGHSQAHSRDERCQPVRSATDSRRTAQAGDRCRPDQSCKIHGEEKAAPVARLEDVPLQSNYELPARNQHRRSCRTAIYTSDRRLPWRHAPIRFKLKARPTLLDPHLRCAARVPRGSTPTSEEPRHAQIRVARQVAAPFSFALPRFRSLAVFLRRPERLARSLMDGRPKTATGAGHSELWANACSTAG
jgi:hypothetical protein